MARYIILTYPRRELPFNPLIGLKRYRKYCKLLVDLWQTPFKFSTKGVDELYRFILEYSRKRNVQNRILVLNEDIVSFNILCIDLEEVLEKVLEIISRNLEPYRPRTYSSEAESDG